jgi:hypothetical protein
MMPWWWLASDSGAADCPQTHPLLRAASARHTVASACQTPDFTHAPGSPGLRRAAVQVRQVMAASPGGRLLQSLPLKRKGHPQDPRTPKQAAHRRLPHVRAGAQAVQDQGRTRTHNVMLAIIAKLLGVIGGRTVRKAAGIWFGTRQSRRCRGGGWRATPGQPIARKQILCRARHPLATRWHSLARCGILCTDQGRPAYAGQPFRFAR